MSPRLALLLPALLAGCSVVVGDIELPEVVGGDGGVAVDAARPDANPGDAARPDARAPDAATPDAQAPDAATPDAQAPDAWTPDAATSDAQAPDAATPDAGPPPEPPPLDMDALRGDWHLYGYTVTVDGIPLAFTALLRYLDGRASLLGFDGARLESDTPFGRDAERPDRLATNLAPLVGVMTGRFDGPSGFGILVNDLRAPNDRPTLVIAVKAPVRRENLDDAFYGRIGTGDATDGETGIFRRAESGYALTNRYGVGVDRGIGEAGLNPEDASAGRMRLTDFSLEDMLGTIAPGGAGYVALTKNGDFATGLHVSWRSHAGEAAIRPGRFWCAGIARDAGGAHAPITVYGDLDGAGQFVWDDGRAGLLAAAGNAYLMRGDDGLFGAEGGVALVDRRGRVYVMLPMRIDEQGQTVLGWGLAACVPVDGGALPELE
jgi:hypothetical protein